MTEAGKGQQADRRAKKYLWFGYGNYTTQGNLQLPAGNVRDPGLLEPLSKGSKERSPMAFFGCAILAVAGLMLFVMLLAWGMTLFLQ